MKRACRREGKAVAGKNHSRQLIRYDCGQFAACLVRLGKGVLAIASPALTTVLFRSGRKSATTEIAGTVKEFSADAEIIFPCKIARLSAIESVLQIA